MYKITRTEDHKQREEEEITEKREAVGGRPRFLLKDASVSECIHPDERGWKTALEKQSFELALSPVIWLWTLQLKEKVSQSCPMSLQC